MWPLFIIPPPPNPPSPISQKLTYNIVNHLSFPQSKNKKKKMLSGYCQYPSQSSEKLHVFAVVKGWKPESHWSCTLRNKFNARKTSRPSTKNDGLKIMSSYLGNPPHQTGEQTALFFSFMWYIEQRGGEKWAIYWLDRRLPFHTWEEILDSNARIKSNDDIVWRGRRL